MYNYGRYSRALPLPTPENERHKEAATLEEKEIIFGLKC
jgi:hypothetical protein